MASERDSSLLLDNIKLLLSSCARTVADFLWRPGALIAQRVGQADKHVHQLNKPQRQPAKVKGPCGAASQLMMMMMTSFIYGRRAMSCFYGFFLCIVF